MFLVLLVPLIISPVYSLDETSLDKTCISVEAYNNEPCQYFDLHASSFNNESLIFNFSSNMNGHLLLFEIDKKKGYKIELGSDYSAINKRIRNRDVLTSDCNITNVKVLWNEWAHLSVTIKNSVISVHFMNISEKWATLVSLNDSTPLNVKILSFTTSDVAGSSSKWLFNCKGSRTTDSADNILPVKRLKKKIFSIHDPHLFPVSNINELSIKASFDLHYLSLNAKESLLTTRGKFYFSWFDPRMQWVPEEYGNITSFNLQPQEIELPDFFQYNSYDLKLSLTEKGVIKISNQGNISWSPEAKLVSWCKLALVNWPFDRQTCIINFGLYSKSNYIDFSLPSRRIKADLFLKNQEWKIISMTEKNNTNLWKVTVELERNAKTLVYAFVYPTIVCFKVTLASFWLPLYASMRLYLHTASLFILLVNLIALDSALPFFLSSTPLLIILNSHLLLLNVIHLLFCCYIMSKVECYHKFSSKIIERIVTNPVILTLFCLSHDPQYYRLKETNQIISEETQQTINQWVIFGYILDRILFILTIIYLSIMTILYIYV